MGSHYHFFKSILIALHMKLHMPRARVCVCVCLCVCVCCLKVPKSVPAIRALTSSPDLERSTSVPSYWPSKMPKDNPVDIVVIIRI